MSLLVFINKFLVSKKQPFSLPPTIKNDLCKKSIMLSIPPPVVRLVC